MNTAPVLLEHLPQQDETVTQTGESLELHQGPREVHDHSQILRAP